MDGAAALFWIAPPDAAKTMDEAYLDFTRPAAEAIKRHGVKRVVSVTALGRGTPWQDTAGLVTASIRMDDLLMSSGAAFRGLAMPSFMENIGRQAGAMKDKGMFFGPIDPEKKVPWTATRDMGAVAAHWLGDDSWTGQEEIPVIGPEDLSHNDIAAIISDVFGREVRYQQIGFDQFKQQFLIRGASESFAQGYVDMYRAKGEGMDNVAERDAASRQRISFRQWAAQPQARARRLSVLEGDPAMSVYDLRVYDVADGQLETLESVLRELALPMMPDHGIEAIGSWAERDTNRLFQLSRHDSREAIESNWDRFHADPRWQEGLRRCGARRAPSSGSRRRS